MKNEKVTISKFVMSDESEWEMFGSQHVFQISRYQDENNFSFEVFGCNIVVTDTDDTQSFICFGIHDKSRMVWISETPKGDGYFIKLDNRAN